jgi:ubiquitin-protein ligase
MDIAINSINKSDIKHNFNINVTINDDYILVDFNDSTNKYIDTFMFKIENASIKPYFTISSKTSYDWLNILNIYSIEKKPQIDKLISKIHSKIKNKSKIVVNSANKLELEYHTEKQRIQKFILDAKSIDIKNAKKIFTDDTIRDIIINDYMKTWKYYYDNKNVKIHTDNLYQFSIELYNINTHLESVKFNMILNTKYHPNYPPSINIVHPELADSLIHRIANSKMFQFNYWNPSTTIIECIEHIKNILIKFGKPINSNTHKANIDENLNNILLILTNYIDIDDDIIDSDKEFVKYNINLNNNTKSLIKKTSSNDKFNGTGYRFGNDSKWKISDYEQIQKEREEELVIVLMQIATSVATLKKDILYHTISNSIFIKFLIKLFAETTLLDMSKRANIFNASINIIQNICVDECVNLFEIKYNNQTLFDVLHKLYTTVALSIKYDDTNPLANSIIFIWTMIEPLQKLNTKFNIESDVKTITNDYKDSYSKLLSTQKFNTANILNNYKQSYKSVLEQTKTSKQCMKRLSSEIPTLSNDIPVHFDASIFLCVNEDSPRAMRVLITGPPNTPYDSGIFVFDIYLPPSYPSEVPMISLMNTGNVRFNPNLYNCGKVCLSILGTYVGPATTEAEKWNSASTLYQVLISIQSQILVEQPIFNEPGFQQYYKTASGERESKTYNESIRLYTTQYAMLDLLEKNSYPEFKNIIQNHFKIKKNQIIENLNKWESEAVGKIKNSYIKIKEKLIAKLNQL